MNDINQMQNQKNDRPPAVVINTGSVSLNEGGAPITADQAWRAIELWIRGDERFAPKFLQTRVVSDDGALITKEVRYHVGTPHERPPRTQVTRLYPGYLAVTTYPEGTYFTAMVGLDLSDPSDPNIFLTTVRHTQDPDFKDPAETAREAGIPYNNDTGQNLRRAVDVIRKLVADGVV